MKKIFLIITLFFILVMSDAYSIYALEPTKMPECTEEPTLEPVIDESDITFEILGEVNEDGIVDATDALLILKHASRLEILNDEKAYLADMNADENIDAKDALDVLKISAKLEASRYYSEISVGDKVVIDGIEVVGGTPYDWSYELNSDNGLIISTELIPLFSVYDNFPVEGGLYEKIYTIESVNSGLYEFTLKLSNSFWADEENIEVLDEIVYIINVKSLSPTIAPTEVPEDYYIIMAGDSKNVTISTAKEKAVFEFTPTESGYYRYHSSGDMYSEFGTINDADGNLLVQRTDYAYYEFGRPVFLGEFSFDYYFEAGKTYLLDAFLEGENTGSFKLTLMLLSEAEEVVINGSEHVNCPYGTEKELSVSYLPEYSIGFVEKWKSSDSNIVTIDDKGIIRGVGIGTAKITATTTNGLTDSIEIEVTDHDEIFAGEVESLSAIFESEAFYKFIPETDGEYIIKTYRAWHNSNTAFIKVYDSGFNEVLYSASGINEDIICEFKAGETYYINLWCDAGDNGFVQYIEVLKIDEIIELSAGTEMKLPDLESA